MRGRTACKHQPTSSADCFAKVKKMPGLTKKSVATKSGSSAAMPAGCSVSVDGATGAATAYWNTDAQSSGGCGGGGGGGVEGSAKSLVTLKVAVAKGVATVTLTGPATVWFGAAFNASLMAEKPYALVVDGKGAVTERKLSNEGIHNTLLKPSAGLKMISNTVADALRTVVLSRPAKGGGSYYSFDESALSVVHKDPCCDLSNSKM